MKLKIILSVSIGCIFSFYAFAQGGNKNNSYFSMPQNVKANDYLPKTIVFKIKPEFRNACRATSIDNEKLNSIFQAAGITSMAKIFPNKTAPVQERNMHGQKLVDLSLIYKMEFTSDANLVKIIHQILSTGMAEYAEPFYVPHVSFNPNDPSTGLQYFLTKINAYLAWDVNQGDTNVVIGIVDTGTDWDHPDLEGNLKYNYGDPINGIDDDGDGYIDNYRGWDLADNDNDPMVGNLNTSQEHGSHVSGCADAITNNGIGVASPGFKCKFLPVKTSMSSDPNAYLVKGYEGIVYAADHGCSVINCSWGGVGGGQFGQDAVTYATINKDALVVCAAGNDNSEETFFPASYQYVLSVASTDNNDSKSSFSNYGANIDLCAPGSNIFSTLYNNTYNYLSGTSMASPIAAGSAAIVKSEFPLYTALQVGEKLRVTCDNIYGVGGNGVYLNKLGRGRINLYNALTALSPSVRFENKVSTDNNDDSFVIGDTLRISGDFVNYLDPTTNLTVSLTTTSPYVTILNGSYSIGVLGTLASVNNSPTPFTVKINAGTPQNSVITFKLTFTDGTYSDVQLFNETVNVDYINITVNDVATTITSKGRLCWNGAAQTEGLGFNYIGNQMNYEAGLMIGNNSNVSDNVRSAGATADNDFQSALIVQKVIPSVQSEFDLYGKFNDNAALAPLKVLVTHKAFAWSTPGNRKFVIVEYSIKNTGTATLSSLYAGIFADWDVMNYALNRDSVDNAHKMGYVYSTEVNGLYTGIKLLTSGPFMHYAIDNVTGGGGGVDITTDYTSAEKYTTLSTNRTAAGWTTGSGNDVCDVTSTGLFSVNAGDSVIVAFALVAGDDLADLQNGADSAQVKYDGLTTGLSSITNDESFIVSQPYPNPATQQLNIDFNLQSASLIGLKVYNTTGQLVFQSPEKNYLQGKHSFNIRTNQFENGIYFFELNVNGALYRNKFTVAR